jgi:DNA-binding transcriptional ArsR family regulator
LGLSKPSCASASSTIVDYVLEKKWRSSWKLGQTADALPQGTRESIAAIAKALGHPARIHIVRLLLEKQSCIGCDIVDEVGLAQSTVSEHLRILKSAGIITGEVEHPRVCYSLNPDRLMPLAALKGPLKPPRAPIVRRARICLGLVCSSMKSSGPARGSSCSWAKAASARRR